jgi:acetyl-CoA acyltransferase
MPEAVIVEALRTPIGRRRGTLSGVHPVDLLGGLLVALVERSKVEPGLVDDVLVGCGSQVGDQALNIARNAWLSAGLPEAVPGATVDRRCGSSLQAVHFAAQGVMAGAYDLVIAGGVECMSRVSLRASIQGELGSPITTGLAERYGLSGEWFSQVYGAELVAQRYGFSRADLDVVSLQSHQRAAAARAAGRLAKEIVAVPIRQADGATVLVEVDEGIRPDASLEMMAKLPPAFEGLELITAGNSSQISDGASVVLIASREMAERLGLRPRASFVSFSVVGDDPVTMLLGPIPATRKALERAGLGVEEIDLFEVNEAFAPVSLAWQQELGAPWERLNVNGGAIALGHPVGATGGRLMATLLHELERREGQYGLVAICEGGGMANATIIRREG